MEGIPESWEALLLGDAVINITINGKKIPQKAYLAEGTYPVFDQGQEYIGGYSDDERKLVECDLPVIIFGDHTRVVKFVNQPFAPGADGVKVLQPQHFYIPKLFEYFTRHIATHLTSHGYARHYQHLVKSIIPVPPINEQYRIVAKIEELFSELDKGIENLKTAQAQLKVYRQALLKHAFEGKLTAQWRADNPDKLEPAATLLARIQTEREQRYRQQLAEWEANGKQGTKPKAQKSLPPLTAEELAELPELPEGWGWVKLGDAAQTDVGFAFKSNEFSAEGIRLLRGENIEPGRLRWLDTKYWPNDRVDEFSNLLVKAGEIIIAMDRPVISSGLKVARAKQSDVPCLLVQRVSRIREQQGVCTEYLLYAIDQNRFVNHCLGNQTGTQLPHISEAQIRSYPLPLCSYEEQVRIGEALDARLSESDQLDQTLTTSLQQSEALRQSILKRAFSGQLVPQDPHDEPAAVLLARIREERESGGKRETIPRRTKKVSA